MLVLQRLRDERVIITLPDGSLIVVTVTKLNEKYVKLGFTADPGVGIHREEARRKTESAEA